MNAAKARYKGIQPQRYSGRVSAYPDGPKGVMAETAGNRLYSVGAMKGQRLSRATVARGPVVMVGPMCGRIVANGCQAKSQLPLRG